MSSFTFDGERIEFEVGDSVAAALLRSGKKVLRTTRFKEEERSLFCGIGNCFDCVLVVDGVTNQRSCIDRKSTRLNSSHIPLSRMPSSA